MIGRFIAAGIILSSTICLAEPTTQPSPQKVTRDGVNVFGGLIGEREFEPLGTGYLFLKPGELFKIADFDISYRPPPAPAPKQGLYTFQAAPPQTNQPQGKAKPTKRCTRL